MREQRLKAKVLKRKNIMVSDPVLHDMNPTRWAYEIENANIAEEDRVEELKNVFEIIRTTFVHLLGLNLLPVEDKDTQLLRMPEENEIVPLAALIANEGILKEVGERYKRMEEEKASEASMSGSAQTEATPEDFEAMVAGDISFDDGVLNRLNWESEEAKTVRAQMITTVTDAASVKPPLVTIESDEEDEENTAPPGKRSRVTIETEE